MNESKIPENEVENVLSVYWQMLRELESKAECSNGDPFLRLLVEGGYTVLNRCEVTKERPSWEK